MQKIGVSLKVTGLRFEIQEKIVLDKAKAQGSGRKAESGIVVCTPFMVMTCGIVK
jgi:hypothetical protein